MVRLVKLLKPVGELKSIGQVCITHPDNIEAFSKGVGLKGEVSVHPVDYDWSGLDTKNVFGYLVEVKDEKFLLTTFTKPRKGKHQIVPLALDGGVESILSMWSIIVEDGYRLDKTAQLKVTVPVTLSMSNVLPVINIFPKKQGGSFWIVRTLTGIPSTKKDLIFNIRHKDPEALLRIAEVILEEVETRVGTVGHHIHEKLDNFLGLCFRLIGVDIQMEVYYETRDDGEEPFLKHVMERVIALTQLKKLAILPNGESVKHQFMVDGKRDEVLKQTNLLLDSRSIETMALTVYLRLPQQNYEFVRNDNQVFDGLKIISAKWPVHHLLSPILFMFTVHRWLLGCDWVQKNLLSLKVTMTDGKFCEIEAQHVGDASFLRDAIQLAATHSYLDTPIKHDYLVMAHLNGGHPKWCLAMGKNINDTDFTAVSLLKSPQHLGLFLMPHQTILLNRPMAIIDARVGHEVRVKNLLKVTLTSSSQEWREVGEALLSGSESNILGLVVRPFGRRQYGIEVLLPPLDNVDEVASQIVSILLGVTIASLEPVDGLVQKPYRVTIPSHTPKLWLTGERGGLLISDVFCTLEALHLLRESPANHFIVTNAKDEASPIVHRIINIPTLTGGLGLWALSKYMKFTAEIALHLGADGVQILILSPDFEIEGLEKILSKAVTRHRLEQLFPNSLRSLAKERIGSLETLLMGSSSFSCRLLPATEVPVFKFVYRLKGETLSPFVMDLVAKTEMNVLQPEGVVAYSIQPVDSGFYITFEALSLEYSAKLDGLLSVLLSSVQDRFPACALFLESDSRGIVPFCPSTEYTAQQVPAGMQLLKPLSFPLAQRKWVYYRMVGTVYERIEEAKTLLERPFLGAYHPIFKDHGKDTMLLVDEDAMGRLDPNVKVDAFNILIPADCCHSSIKRITEHLLSSTLSIFAMRQQKTIKSHLELEFWFLNGRESALWSELIPFKLSPMHHCQLPKLVTVQPIKSDIPLADWQVYHQCIGNQAVFKLPFTMADADNFVYKLMVNTLLPGYRIIFTPGVPTYDVPHEHPAVEMNCPDLEVALRFLEALGCLVEIESVQHRQIIEGHPKLLAHGLSLLKKNLIRLELEWPMVMGGGCIIRLYHMATDPINAKAFEEDLNLTMKLVLFIDAMYGDSSIVKVPQWTLDSNLNPKSKAIEYQMKRQVEPIPKRGDLRHEAWVELTGKLSPFFRHRLMRVMLQFICLPTFRLIYHLSILSDSIRWSTLAGSVDEINAAGSILVKFLRSAEVPFKLTVKSEFFEKTREPFPFPHKAIVRSVPARPFACSTSMPPGLILNAPQEVRGTWAVSLVIVDQRINNIPLDPVHLPAILRPFKESSGLTTLSIHSVDILSRTSWWEFSITLEDAETIRSKLMKEGVSPLLRMWLWQATFGETRLGTLLIFYLDGNLHYEQARWLAQRLIDELELDPARFVRLRPVLNGVSMLLNPMALKPFKAGPLELTFYQQGAPVYSLRSTVEAINLFMRSVMRIDHPYGISLTRMDRIMPVSVQLVKPSSLEWSFAFLYSEQPNLLSLHHDAHQTIINIGGLEGDLAGLKAKIEQIDVDLVASKYLSSCTDDSDQPLSLDRAFTWQKGRAKCTEYSKKVTVGNVREVVKDFFTMQIKEVSMLVNFNVISSVLGNKFYLQTKIHDAGVLNAKAFISSLWSAINTSPHYFAIIVERHPKHLEISLGSNHLDVHLKSKLELEATIQVVFPTKTHDPIKLIPFGKLEVDCKFVKHLDKPDPKFMVALHSANHHPPPLPLNARILRDGEFVDLHEAIKHETDAKRIAEQKARLERQLQIEHDLEMNQLTADFEMMRIKLHDEKDILKCHKIEMHRLEKERLYRREQIVRARNERKREFCLPLDTSSSDDDMGEVVAGLEKLDLGSWVLWHDGESMLIQSIEMLKETDLFETHFLLQRAETSLHRSHFEASVAIYPVSLDFDTGAVIFDLIQDVLNFNNLVAIECIPRTPTPGQYLDPGVRIVLHFDPDTTADEIRNLLAQSKHEWLISEYFGSGYLVPDFS